MGLERVHVSEAHDHHEQETRAEIGIKGAVEKSLVLSVLDTAADGLRYVLIDGIEQLAGVMLAAGGEMNLERQLANQLVLRPGIAGGKFGQLGRIDAAGSSKRTLVGRVSRAERTTAISNSALLSKWR